MNMAMSGEEAMDVVQAAALLDQTQRSTRQALQAPYALIYLTWGLAWLIGLGAMWLSVRAQQPYHGPSGLSAAVLGTLMGVASLVTSLLIVRATRGVGGHSAVQGLIWGMAFSAGFASWFAIAGAIDHYGASRAVLGITYAVGPVLVTGLVYMVAAAVWAESSMLILGAWLVVICVVAAWSGPVNVLLVEALTGGGGFLVASMLLARRRGW
jgi:hypothetical protein